jgi:hypothetical protein
VPNSGFDHDDLGNFLLPLTPRMLLSSSSLESECMTAHWQMLASRCPLGFQVSWESLGAAKKQQQQQASYGQLSSWKKSWLASSGIERQAGHLLPSHQTPALGLQLTQKDKPV